MLLSSVILKLANYKCFTHCYVKEAGHTDFSANGIRA